MVNRLQADNEQLIEQARRDNQNLEAKAVEVERLKGRNSNLMKENGEIRQELRRAQQSSSHSASNNKKVGNAIQNTTRAPLPSRSTTYMRQNTARPSTARMPAKNFDLDMEMDVKHFDEIRNKHIEDFTQMMSNLFVSQPPQDRLARSTVKLPNTHSLDPQNSSDPQRKHSTDHPGPKGDHDMATDDIGEGAGNEPSSMALEDHDSALDVEGVPPTDEDKESNSSSEILDNESDEEIPAEHKETDQEKAVET